MCVFVGGNEVSLKELLAFWTGADVIPPMGFAQPLRIEFFSKDIKETTRYPSANTCALQMNLPRGIEEPDDLKELIVFAIKNTGGFYVV